MPISSTTPLPAVIPATIMATQPQPEPHGAVLTPRQAQILTLMSEGFSNKQIGRQLDLSHKTVETHRIKAARAIGARSAMQAAVLWDRMSTMFGNSRTKAGEFLAAVGRAHFALSEFGLTTQPHATRAGVDAAMMEVARTAFEAFPAELFDVPVDTHAPVAPAARRTAADRDRFTTIGRVILRNGEPFARGATDEIAKALCLTLNDAQLLFTDVPVPDQEFVERTLWSTFCAPQKAEAGAPQ